MKPEDPLWTRDPDRDWHWDEDPLVFYADSPDLRDAYYKARYGYGRQVVLERVSPRPTELACYFVEAGTVREGLEEALRHMPYPVHVNRFSTLWGR